MSPPLARLPSYAVVTAACNEEANLPRLARSLRGQTVLPTSWAVVDDGSTDGTPGVLEELARDAPWVATLKSRDRGAPARGAAVAAALQAGFAVLPGRPDVVVVADADVSFAADFFERLLAAFAREASLGVASGVRHDRRDGRWVPHRVTSPNVEAQCRAYRADCLAAILPYDRHKGWDSIDVLKAVVGGWTTRVVADLPFRHHRPIGKRDGRSHRAWLVEGDAAHYLGYRVGYLLLRSLYHARRDPAALMLPAGYAGAALRRARRCPDRRVRAELRRRQSLRELPRRIREVRRG